MATYLLYLDEQEGEIGGEFFTAIVGFRIAVGDINAVRAGFYPRFNEIVDRNIRGAAWDSNRHIHRPPHLHGSDFLRDYSDEDKFEVLDALSDSLDKVNFRLLRVGYFNRSFPALLNVDSRTKRINQCLSSIAFSIWDKPKDEHIIISEIDKEALRINLETNFNNVGQYFAAGRFSGSHNMKRIVGHFYAPKSDLGCQIADLFNYSCYKHTQADTRFSKRFAGYYERFSSKYSVNQIIWINNSARNYNLPQINPVAGEGSQNETDPITRVFGIIPNDERLETFHIPPVD